MASFERPGRNRLQAPEPPPRGPALRRLALACGLTLILAAPAAAGTVSGRLTDSTNPRLDVTYQGVPGKHDEVRVLPHPTGVRIVDARGITAGAFCFAVNGNDARCGPPAPEGLQVIARTGDKADFGFTHIGSLILGSYVSRNDRVTGCEVVTYGWPD